MFKFSLITVCYNPGAELRDCLFSIASQSLKVEHLLIDASRHAKALDLVLSEAPHTSIIHEPDAGLYNALNKAVRLAQGDFIGFLHADDVLANRDVLADIVRCFEQSGAEAVYGDLNYVSHDLSRVVRRWRSGEPQSFKWGWMPPHPSLYVRRELFERVGPFREDLGSAADYEWMLRAIEVNKMKMAYLPKLFVNMRVGGMSNANWRSRWSAFWGDYRALKINGIKRPLIVVMRKKLMKIKQFVS